MKTTKRNDGPEWLREIRARLAKILDYDPRKTGDYFRPVQKESGAEIYQREAPAGSDVHAHDDLHDQARAEVTAGQQATVTSCLADRKRRSKRAK